jgi:tetratricopeptide (TPR) repeat protein
VLSVERIVRQLDARFDLLVDGKRDATSHQKALRTSLDWSYDLLDPPEREVFTRAGVFAGAFSIDAARALCGGSELVLSERLGALVDKSLLTAQTDEGGEVRFRMLESLRMYARDRLDASGAGDALRSRHLDVIAAAFIDVRDRFSATPREALFLELAPLLDDARVALEWALRGDDADLERGVLLLCATKLWDRLGLSPEALALAQAFLARIDASRPDLASELWRLAAYAGDRSKWTGALEAGDRAIACARMSGDGDQLAAALAQRAFVASRFGKLAEGAADLDEAEAAAPVTAARRLLIIAARGFLASLEGRLDDAARAQAEILDTNRFLGNAGGVIHGTGNLAEIEHMRGNTDRSIALAEDHIATIGEMTIHSTLKLNLIGYYLALDDVARAKPLAQSELEHYGRTDPGGMHESIVLGYVALIAAIAGESRYAAQLNAYVEERYRSGAMEREHTERVVSEKLNAILDESLEPADRERAVAEGRAWPRERAVFEGTRLAR